MRVVVQQTQQIASVGCASIDLQHALLAKLVGDIVTCLRNGGTDADFLRDVREFRSALVSHFAAEQDVLAACGYEKHDEHAAKHAEVVARLDEAIAALSHVTSASARFAIVNEFEDILYSHELLDDAEYAGRVGGLVPSFDQDPPLTVGVDWVDEQHRQLFVVLDVFRLHASRGDWEMSRFVLSRLIERVKTHFDNEDFFLKTKGAAAFGHRRHHFEALLSLEQLLEDADDAALRTIDGFVCQLLRNHILDEDIKDFAPG